MKRESPKPKFEALARPSADGFGSLIDEVRSLVKTARQAAATTINTLQVLTNFEIGRGFSEDNLSNMRRFYLAWSGRVAEFPRSLLGNSAQQPSKKWSNPFSLSWSHYVLLLGIKDLAERNFYEIEASR